MLLSVVSVYFLGEIFSPEKSLGQIGSLRQLVQLGDLAEQIC